MTKTARDFLKKKFGTISRFYSNITTADTADVNGFSRINTLRKALAALDRGGWERSYHQRIFHVRLYRKKAYSKLLTEYSHTSSPFHMYIQQGTKQTRHKSESGKSY
jgi:hypothetical protein